MRDILARMPDLKNFFCQLLDNAIGDCIKSVLIFATTQPNSNLSQLNSEQLKLIQPNSDLV